VLTGNTAGNHVATKEELDEHAAWLRDKQQKARELRERRQAKVKTSQISADTDDFGFDDMGIDGILPPPGTFAQAAALAQAKRTIPPPLAEPNPHEQREAAVQPQDTSTPLRSVQHCSDCAGKNQCFRCQGEQLAALNAQSVARHNQASIPAGGDAPAENVVETLTTQPVAAKRPRAPTAAALARQAAAANPRNHSRRMNSEGKHLTQKELLVLARPINSRLPAGIQVKNLSNCTVAELDDFLDNEAHNAQVASLRAQCEAAQTRMTAAVSRAVCLRILMLLATDPILLSLYMQSRGPTDRIALDAGANQHVNTGQGMGLNHAYFVALVQAFNDITIVHDFPFEYYPNLEDASASGETTVPVPFKIRNGLFAGLGIKQAGIPLGFPQGFFDTARLDKEFTAGLNEYHGCMARFHVSGQHGKPLWYFVSPCKTVQAEDQALHLDLAAKRWDSLGFHCVFQQVQELAPYLIKTVPGGKGGPVTEHTRAQGASGRAVRASSDAARQDFESQAQVRAEKQLAMQQEMHALQVAAFKHKQEQHVQSGFNAVAAQIKDLLHLKQDFDKLGSSTMMLACQDQIDALQKQLTLPSSSPSFMSPPANAKSYSQSTPESAGSAATPSTL